MDFYALFALESFTYEWNKDASVFPFVKNVYFKNKAKAPYSEIKRIYFALKLII